MIDLYPTVVRKNVPFVAYISPFAWLFLTGLSVAVIVGSGFYLYLRPGLPCRTTSGNKTPDAIAGV